MDGSRKVERENWKKGGGKGRELKREERERGKKDEGEEREGQGIIWREREKKKQRRSTHLKVSIVFFIIIKASCIFNDCLTSRTKTVGEKLSSLCIQT